MSLARNTVKAQLSFKIEESVYPITLYFTNDVKAFSTEQFNITSEDTLHKFVLGSAYCIATMKHHSKNDSSQFNESLDEATEFYLRGLENIKGRSLPRIFYAKNEIPTQLNIPNHQTNKFIFPYAPLVDDALNKLLQEDGYDESQTLWASILRLKEINNPPTILSVMHPSLESATTLEKAWEILPRLPTAPEDAEEKLNWLKLKIQHHIICIIPEDQRKKIILENATSTPFSLDECVTQKDFRTLDLIKITDILDKIFQTVKYKISDSLMEALKELAPLLIIEKSSGYIYNSYKCIFSDEFLKLAVYQAEPIPVEKKQQEPSLDRRNIINNLINNLKNDLNKLTLQPDLKKRATPKLAELQQAFEETLENSFNLGSDSEFQNACEIYAKEYNHILQQFTLHPQKINLALKRQELYRFLDLKDKDCCFNELIFKINNLDTNQLQLEINTLIPDVLAKTQEAVNSPAFAELIRQEKLSFQKPLRSSNKTFRGRKSSKGIIVSNDLSDDSYFLNNLKKEICNLEVSIFTNNYEEYKSYVEIAINLVKTPAFVHRDKPTFRKMLLELDKKQTEIESMLDTTQNTPQSINTYTAGCEQGMSYCPIMEQREEGRSFILQHGSEAKNNVPSKEQAKRIAIKKDLLKRITQLKKEINILFYTNLLSDNEVLLENTNIGETYKTLRKECNLFIKRKKKKSKSKDISKNQENSHYIFELELTDDTPPTDSNDTSQSDTSSETIFLTNTPSNKKELATTSINWNNDQEELLIDLTATMGQKNSSENSQDSVTKTQPLVIISNTTETLFTTEAMGEELSDSPKNDSPKISPQLNSRNYSKSNEPSPLSIETEPKPLTVKEDSENLLNDENDKVIRIVPIKPQKTSTQSPVQKSEAEKKKDIAKGLGISFLGACLFGIGLAFYILPLVALGLILFGSGIYIAKNGTEEEVKIASVHKHHRSPQTTTIMQSELTLPKNTAQKKLTETQITSSAPPIIMQNREASSKGLFHAKKTTDNDQQIPQKVSRKMSPSHH